MRADTNQDSDFSGADLIGQKSDDTAINTFTQELRLTSDFDGPVNFLIGGYYFHEKIRQHSQIYFGDDFRPYGNALIQAASGGLLDVPTLETALGAPSDSFFHAGDGMDEHYRMKNTAWSIFGTLDFGISDRLTLTLGGNYTKDKKRFTTDVTSTDVFSGIDLDATAYAPFRNQLLYQGGLAQQIGSALGLGRSATAAEIGAFAGADPATFGAISTGVQAYADANENNAAVNP